MDKLPGIPGCKIEGKLGQGRIVDVYLAVKEEIEQKVVIKVLIPDLAKDKKFSERFLSEARRAAKLDHPNIVKILDVGETPDHYYIIEEYLQENLRSRVVKRQLSTNLIQETREDAVGSSDMEGVDPYEVLDIFKQLFDALDYAFEEEVIHRDLRPDNIFFREDRTPVIVDFYMSRLVDASDVLEKKRVTISFAHYASPERILKQPADLSSDIYSLGVTLYEMLTGMIPFDAKEVAAIKEPVPQLPEHFKLFQLLIDRMMAKTKEERAQSGVELILMMEELREEIPGEENKVEELVEEEMETEEDQIEEAKEAGEFQLEEMKEAEELLMEEVKEVEELQMEDRKEAEELLMEKVKEVEELQMGEVKGAEEEQVEEEKEADLGQLIEQEMGTGLVDRVELNQESPQKKDFTFKQADAPSRASELLTKLRNSRMLIPAAAVIVILVISVIFFSSSGDSDRKESTGPKQVLSTKGQQEIEIRYTRKFKAAQSAFKAGKYEEALQQLTQAGKIKTSKELETLRQKTEAKIADKKENQSFEKASKINTRVSYEEYLSKYSSGHHAEEAKKKIEELIELEKKRKAERKKWAASRVKLRSTYKMLTASEIKSRIIKLGFFEKYYNKTGNFLNHYKTRIINNHKIILDYATGLIWHQAGSVEHVDYQKALLWMKELNQQKYAGYSDWRLPTLEEAVSLLESSESKYFLYIDPLFSQVQKHIWTGDKFGNNRIWAVDFYSGDVNRALFNSESFVRPVRSEK